MSEITVYRLKQRIRAADGTWRTLTSYDGGLTWGMDQRRAYTRFKRGARLRPEFGKKAIERMAIGSTTKEAPVFFPVIHHHGGGNARGKKQKNKPNLSRK